jgi:hypothetical protein
MQSNRMSALEMTRDHVQVITDTLEVKGRNTQTESNIYVSIQVGILETSVLPRL